ncbi:polymer-forming cytoskeletal protein [Prolixibacteraceae bacterium Z1-6]|uniref:Polymer-forming cytoskeletal protein n=1 Tax=Draconibacterium aestuarii TaxID=2998507 RepID=A0A9X3F8K4_9BACT|nr:polymer-forming cytoskeletal protein [Prolixibacteraceae bacterium Z1-6]
MAKQTYTETSNSSINIISEGTSIKGDINANSDTRIDGELIGNITSKGKLVVGPKGTIAGEIKCTNVEVSGLIKGKVTVAELLIMKSSSKIEGDIIAGKLSVEPGADFTGTCAMGGSGTVTNNEKEKTLYTKKS